MNLGRAQCQTGDYTLALPPCNSRSTRRRPPATCGWLPSLESTWVGFCVRSDRSLQRGRPSKRRPHGTATQAGESKPRWPIVCWPPWMPRITSLAPRNASSPILDKARQDDDAPVEVLALDALARIAATVGDSRTSREL